MPQVLNWLWNFRVVFNALIMFLNAFVLTGLVITSFVSEGSLNEMSPQDIEFLRFVFAFTVFYSLSPFFLGLMSVSGGCAGACSTFCHLGVLTCRHSWRSFKTMLDAFQSYYVRRSAIRQGL